MLADAINTILWLQKRVPQSYRAAPHVQQTLVQLNTALAQQESIGDRYAHRLAVILECALLDPMGTWDAAHKLLDEYRTEHEWSSRERLHQDTDQPGSVGSDPRAVAGSAPQGKE